MLLAALLTMSQLPLPLVPAADEALQAKLAECLEVAREAPSRAQADAQAWADAGGGYYARQCLGVAYANQQRWSDAGRAFEAGAREAEAGHDSHAADLWAQAGNAWLAAGEAGKARTALDAALAPGVLLGMALGEAHLDRARARVAGGDLEGARGDLDRAIENAPDDPLAWLLSATLARRAGTLDRAQKDILEALRRSPEDASVQLEAGNIAVLGGRDVDARAAWTRAIELAPGSPQANAARTSLDRLAAQ